MKLRKREIARAGIFGSEENQKIVTKADIREIAETFSDIKSVPVQFGHNAKAEDPRLGNVVSVYADPAGKSLYADIEENEALADAVDAGFYPDVSICAAKRPSDGKMYLRHLAYLGQEAPAVKNLMKKIKEPLGIAAADTDSLIILPAIAEFKMELSESIKPNKEGNSVTKEEALREENDRLKKELEKSKIELSDAQEKKQQADIDRLKAAMNTAGTPIGLQEKFLEVAGAFDPGKMIELSDTDGTKKMGSPMDALIRAVTAIPPPVITGALNLSDLDNSVNRRDISRLKNKG